MAQKKNEINTQLEKAQFDAANKFVRWSANPKGPVPGPLEVDDLQAKSSAHMASASDDAFDKDLQTRVRSEQFAQAHRENVGIKPGYVTPLHYTQTLEYQDGLSGDDRFLLDDSKMLRVKIRAVHPRRCPHQVNQISDSTSTEARKRIASALAGYATANPDEYFSIAAADRERLASRNKNVSDGSDDESETCTELI